MNVLLDTQIVIELIDKNFDGFAEADIFEHAVGKNSFFVSQVSIWEVAIKSRLGKLKLPIPLSAWNAAIFEAGGVMLNITQAHILADIGPEPSHKDPFDRLLLSTAAAENCKLLTRDREMTSHPLAWKPFPF